ncbi:hypothetical protein WJ968_33580 [Achromobacter xylosoxidans]
MIIGQIVARLRGLDFDIHRVEDITHGGQVDLGCGIKISAYMNGAVMAQGKFVDRPSRAEGLPILQKILPAKMM